MRPPDRISVVRNLFGRADSRLFSPACVGSVFQYSLLALLIKVSTESCWIENYAAIAGSEDQPFDFTGREIITPVCDLRQAWWSQRSESLTSIHTRLQLGNLQIALFISPPRAEEPFQRQQHTWRSVRRFQSADRTSA